MMEIGKASYTARCKTGKASWMARGIKEGLRFGFKKVDSFSEGRGDKDNFGTITKIPSTLTFDRSVREG